MPDVLFRNDLGNLFRIRIINGAGLEHRVLKAWVKHAPEKEQVQHMVQLLLKLPGKPQEDAADALAIAITHAHTNASLVANVGVRKFSRGRMR